jgi:hypothetical protein
MNAALRSPEPDNDADPVDDSRTVNDVECTSSREVILDLAEAWVLPVVLDLDGAHSELTGETWCPPPVVRGPGRECALVPGVGSRLPPR